MDIILSANNNEQVHILPVLPTDMPDILNTYKNTTFDSLDCEYNLIGNKGLRSLTFSSFFPNQKYSFMRPNSSYDAMSYINFLEYYANNKMPFRLIALHDDNSEIINIALTLDSFSWQVRTGGDIYYTLNMTEYVFLK